MQSPVAIGLIANEGPPSCPFAHGCTFFVRISLDRAVQSHGNPRCVMTALGIAKVGFLLVRRIGQLGPSTFEAGKAIYTFN